MKTQNITLSLPKDLLRAVKRFAIEREQSISGLMTQMLQDLIARNNQYQVAQQRQLTQMENGLDLGTHGNIQWTRESLHER